MKRLKLNIQLFGSGSATNTSTSSAGNKGTLSVSFSEDPNLTNINNNTTRVNASATFTLNTGSFSSITCYLKIFWHDNRENTDIEKKSLTVTTIAKRGSVSTDVSFDVTHNSDGTLNGYAFARWQYNGSSSLIPPTMNASPGWITLITVPRASTGSATNIDIGGTSNIAINRKSDNFTTSVGYTFGNLSDTIATKTSSVNIPWNTSSIASSLYQQIPSSKNGTATIWIDTYNGSNQIGSRQYATLTLTANEANSKPNVGITSVVDTNLTTVHLTAGSSATTSQVIVKGFSTAVITATRSVKNSSWLTNFYLNDTDVGTTSTTRTIQNVNTNVFKAKAVDSRGYSNETSTTKTGANYIEYIPIQYTASFTRSTPTDGKVVLSYNGSWFGGNFGQVQNELIVKYRYKQSGETDFGNWITLTPTSTSDNKFRQDITLGNEGTFDYTKQYDFQLLVSDKLNTSGTAYNQSITQGIPTFWWDEDLHVEGDLYLGSNRLLDMLHPVGEIYLTTSSQFDPNISFGGEWTQLTGNEYLRIMSGSMSQSGGSNYISTSNMPSHSHPVSITTGSSLSDGTSSNSFYYGGTAASQSFGNITLTQTSLRLYSQGAQSTNQWAKMTANLSHTHSVEGNTGNSGSGTEFNPKYYGCYAWRRTR